MSINTKFYGAENFNKFPWDKLIYGKSKTNGENFSFGKGGVGFPNGMGWNITIYHEDGLTSENWALPKALSEMLDWQREYGKKENQRKTQSAFREILGIK